MDQLTGLLRKDDPLLSSWQWQGHYFPGIWAEMMPPEFLRLAIPRERQATCAHCPKSCYEAFRPDYRCCTYHPRVANFLLGLASETPTGRQAVESLISGSMLLPEGMHASPKQWLDFLDDQENDRFGRSTKVLCPLLIKESGLCSIHAFRNSVCSSYFCESDHGATGREFWGQIQTLGSQLEMALGQWALREIGFDLERYFATLNSLAPRLAQSSAENGWSAEALDLLWGSWKGRELFLLRESAAAIVSQRTNLWTIANQQTRLLLRADAFEAALDKCAGIDAEDDDAVNFSAADSWANCQEVHALLWSWPSGPCRLSPHASFTANTLRSDEERYHAAKPYFLEYRFGDDLQWRLAVSGAERDLLLRFRDAPQSLGEGLTGAAEEAETFLREMLNRKVLWPYRPQPRQEA